MWRKILVLVTFGLFFGYQLTYQILYSFNKCHVKATLSKIALLKHLKPPIKRIGDCAFFQKKFTKKGRKGVMHRHENHYSKQIVLVGNFQQHSSSTALFLQSAPKNL